MSLRGVWILTSCPMWSTMSCPTSQKTMCIALAALDAQATPDEPFLWCVRTNTPTSRASNVYSTVPSLKMPFLAMSQLLQTQLKRVQPTRSGLVEGIHKRNRRFQLSLKAPSRTRQEGLAIANSFALVNEVVG